MAAVTAAAAGERLPKSCSSVTFNTFSSDPLLSSSPLPPASLKPRCSRLLNRSNSTSRPHSTAVRWSLSHLNTVVFLNVATQTKPLQKLALAAILKLFGTVILITFHFSGYRDKTACIESPPKHLVLCYCQILLWDLWITSLFHSYHSWLSTKNSFHCGHVSPVLSLARSPNYSNRHRHRGNFQYIKERWKENVVAKQFPRSP